MELFKGYYLYFLFCLLGIGVIAELVNTQGRDTNQLDDQIATKSVATFAYDSTRSGHVKSNINSQTPLIVKKTQSEQVYAIKNALKYTPIYINGFRDAQGTVLQNKRVLIYAKNRYLMAVDVDTYKMLWTLKFPPLYHLRSTPVFDIERQFIYFYTAKDVQKGPRKGSRLHQIYQVDLNGKVIVDFEIDVDKIFTAKNLNSPKYAWSRRIYCKTAMGLNKIVAPNYVFFACSISTGTKNETYGAPRGLSGVLFAYELDKQGKLRGSKFVKTFFTSQVDQENPNTGFDTGIYNVGSGPTLLPDGSMLLATGNGPVFLNEKNFGCSVVRISGENIKAMKNEDGSYMAFSHSEPPFNECWYSNIEYTSSAVASMKFQNTQWSAVISKDGFLEVFDSEKMEPHKKTNTRVKIGGFPTYGQPVMLRQEKSIRIFAAAKNWGKKSFYDELLVDKENLEQLRHKTEAKCYGWLSSSYIKNEQALSFFYSGPVRKDYTVAIKKSPFHKSLTTFFSKELGDVNNIYNTNGLWAPYVWMADLGYSLPKNFKHNIFGAHVERLSFVGEFLNFKKINRKDHSEKFYSQENFYFLKNLDESKTCDRVQSEALKPIYRVTRKAETSVSLVDQVVAFDIGPEKQLQKKWAYKLSQEESLMRVHPVVSTDAEGKHPIVIALISHELTSGHSSTLVLIDGNSGKELNRIMFTGTAHFSMPLVLDEKIIVPTIDQGLQIFSAAPQKNFQYYWRHSLLRSALLSVRKD